MQKVILNLCTHQFTNSLEYSWSSHVYNMENLVFGPMPKWSQFTEFFLTKSYQQILAEKEKKQIQETKRIVGELAEAQINTAVRIY